MVFPVVVYGCENWTVKKTEHQRIDAFELWCWRRFLRVAWTARRSCQSILKEISPGCSLKGLMLKLKLQYLGHLMSRADSLEKTLMVGKTEGRRRYNRGWDGWMASLTQWTWVWVNSGSWWWTGRPGMLWFMGSQRVGYDWVTELNWQYGGEDLTCFKQKVFMEISFGTIPISSFPFFCRLLIVHPKPSEKIFGLLVLFTMFSHYDYHSNIYSNLQLLPDLAILWVANSIHWFWQP